MYLPEAPLQLRLEELTAVESRFVTLYEQQPHPIVHDSPARMTKHGIEMKVAKIITLAGEGELPEIEHPVPFKLSLIADYKFSPDRPEGQAEQLHCIQAHTWSPEWRDGSQIGDIAHPCVTVGSLAKDEDAPGKLALLAVSFDVAEVVAHEDTAPDLSVLL